MSALQVRGDFLLLWLLATSALCMGLVINQFRDKPLPLTYKNKAERLQEVVQKITAPPPSVPATENAPLPAKMTLEDFAVYVDGRKGLILDARPEIFHRLGHVPGALSLPREDFENGYNTLKARLEADQAQPLVVYCSSSSCEDASLVRKSLAGLGYTNLAVFEGGWSEWTAAGKPEETAP
jgi:3-mercaptopyruvate sulfurtransferase SseA